MREMLEKKCLAILQKMDGTWPGYQVFSLEVGLSIHESMQLLNGLAKKGLVEKMMDNNKFSGWKIVSEKPPVEVVIEETPPEVIKPETIESLEEVEKPIVRKPRKKK